MAIAWNNGKLTMATLKASETKPVTVRYNGKEVQIAARAGQTIELGPDLQRNQ